MKAEGAAIAPGTADAVQKLVVDLSILLSTEHKQGHWLPQLRLSRPALQWRLCCAGSSAWPGQTGQTGSGAGPSGAQFSSGMNAPAGGGLQPPLGPMSGLNLGAGPAAGPRQVRMYCTAEECVQRLLKMSSVVDKCVARGDLACNNQSTFMTGIGSFLLF